jgi:hypothetical protein
MKLEKMFEYYMTYGHKVMGEICNTAISLVDGIISMVWHGLN